VKIVFLTTDNRDHFRNSTDPIPVFGPAPDALLRGFALLPEVEVHIITCARRPLPAPENLAPNLVFHSVFVPQIGWMRTLFQGCVRAVRKKVRELGADIVHGQGTEGHNALAAALSSFPNVATIHGNMRAIARLERPRPFTYNWLAARLEGWAIPRNDGVVCITRHAQEEVRGLARRTWVVPNAVDTSFYQVNAEPAPDVPAKILCLGRVRPLKNQIALIRAMDPVANNRRFDLVFVGGADEAEPYGAEFAALVKARSWCSRIGHSTREKLQVLLKKASLLVLPSLEENCPMVVLEAMAAGVPVVGAKVGGVPDLIEEGRTGWFCDPRDGESMRKAIETALANPAVAAEVARLAQERALERFHPKSVAQRHVEIYREVIASRGGH
jgi:glycosyltransferase involved in cell wall biosynthesis